MAKKKIYQLRKAAGVCTQCGKEAYVNPVTLKRHIYCAEHHQAALNRVAAWKERHPESFERSRKKELARRRNLRRAGKFKTKRADDYLRWLFGELRRLRDLDAMGDVKQ